MDDTTQPSIDPEVRGRDASAGGEGLSSHVWDEATRPEVARLVEEYEALWRGGRLRRPNVDGFLKERGSDFPGIRLALLRADMGLRWESGERVRVERYLQRFVSLDDEQRVALAYEEYCLRDEAGEKPQFGEYYARFPELAARLQRLFDIHDLVGTGSSTALSTPLPDLGDSIYPMVGETIGGFVLDGELGRGAFARVYLAKERNLSNRQVALKLARFGTSEPHVLAKLQHTHIVPIHSYRTDAGTGLHLICMPFVGRVTLSRLLADEGLKGARKGSDLLGLLDKLDTDSAKAAEGSGLAQRRKFAGLSYVRAIAFWGAKLAEALSYAHEHGVLHGDIKPSNVLLTADASPMLLDFNLSQSAKPEGAAGPARAALGGTFPYMAPEQLEALAGTDAAGIDARSDIFSLGVVLYEAVGSRPFEKKPTFSAGSLNDVLLQAASQRRREAPDLRAAFPQVPRSFEAVVRKCLAPEPEDRYATAAELAEDLLAVAEDGPLRHASEPQPSRAFRWVRRNRVGLTLLVPLVVSAVFLGIAAVGARMNLIQLEKNVNELMLKAKAAEDDAPGEALGLYLSAERMAHGRRELAGLEQGARLGARRAEATRAVRQDVEALSRDSGALRFALMGFDANERTPALKIRERLRPFEVFKAQDWRERPELSLLEAGQKDSLIREVDELLFFWAVSMLADTRSAVPLLEDVVRVCRKAVGFSESPGPWNGLQSIAEARIAGSATTTLDEPRVSEVDSAWTCFQWGMIHSKLDRDESIRSLRWLNRSVLLDPKQYWAQYFLGYRYDREGQSERALAHYNAAIALEPDKPWTLFSRARLSWPTGDWDVARLDLDRAIELAEKKGMVFQQAYLERGVVKQRLGDFDGARADYAKVLGVVEKGTSEARSVRMNVAHLDFSEGNQSRALAAYDGILGEDLPKEDRIMTLNARIRVRAGRADWPGVEADLAELEELQGGVNARFLALRGEMRLSQGQAEAALRDIEAAERTEVDPALSRLRSRAALAAGRYERVTCEDPDDYWTLPGTRAELRRDLERFADAALNDATADLDLAMTQASARAALGDRRALEQAEGVVAAWPGLVRAHLVHARVLQAFRDWPGASAAVEDGLRLDPTDARLLELKAQILLSEGSAREALLVLEMAGRAGMTPTLHATEGRAHAAVRDWRQALLAWREQLKTDRENPQWYLMRARVARRAGLLDLALSDLEVAAGLAEQQRPDLLGPIALEYAGCLRGRENRADRVWAIARSALLGGNAAKAAH